MSSLQARTPGRIYRSVLGWSTRPDLWETWSALMHRREELEASPEAMRERLSRLPRGCNTVLLVGHQPGLGALARRLANGHENRRCRRAFEHFPTAAAAVLGSGCGCRCGSRFRPRLRRYPSRALS